MRILITDDSEMVRRAVPGLLSAEASWEICGEAGNSPEGLEQARELRPDLVLLDVNMPGVSGLKTAGLMRAERIECGHTVDFRKRDFSLRRDITQHIEGKIFSRMMSLQLLEDAEKGAGTSQALANDVVSEKLLLGRDEG